MKVIQISEIDNVAVSLHLIEKGETAIIGTLSVKAPEEIQSPKQTAKMFIGSVLIAIILKSIIPYGIL